MSTGTEKEYLSVTQVASLLGISRQAVHKHIKKGTIKALKVGSQYVISREQVKSMVGDVIGHTLSEDEKRKIDKIIDKTIEEYGEVLEWLGSD